MSRAIHPISTGRSPNNRVSFRSYLRRGHGVAGSERYVQCSSSAELRSNCQQIPIFHEGPKLEPIWGRRKGQRQVANPLTYRQITGYVVEGTPMTQQEPDQLAQPEQTFPGTMAQ